MATERAEKERQKQLKIAQGKATPGSSQEKSKSQEAREKKAEYERRMNEPLTKA